jgi:hypothetical protein
MGVDEKFFHWILKLKRKKQYQRLEKKLVERGAYFTWEHEGELAVFASALWKRSIEVKSMDGSGDFDQKTLFLPKYFCPGHTKESNRSAALLRVLHEHQFSLGNKKNEDMRLHLEKSYPNYTTLLSLVENNSPDSSVIWPSVRPDLKESSKQSLSNLHPEDVNQTKGAEAHLKMLPKGRLKHLDELKKDNIGDQVFHSFEKIETVEEFKGVNRQAEGLRRGVPDIMLAVMRCGNDGRTWGGLFVEMKRADHSNHATPAQQEWIERLRAYGYSAIVAYGCEEAKQAIMAYLAQEGVA